jgi:hypothetical protein
MYPLVMLHQRQKKEDARELRAVLACDAGRYGAMTCGAWSRQKDCCGWLTFS